VSDERDEAAPVEERTSPLFGQVALLVAFAAIVLASVFTVLVPELRDEGDEGDEAPAQDEADAQEEADAPGESDEPVPPR